MTQDKKEKLMKYLYPTENMRKFLCNDLYQELKDILLLEECINSKNLTKTERIKRLLYLTSKIKNFFDAHKEYDGIIRQIYSDDDNFSIYKKILIGYVFYIVCTERKYIDIDIFRDKRSVCYEVPSIIDFLK